MATRREFMTRCAAAVGGAALVLKAGVAEGKTLAIGLDKVPQLKEVGGAVIVKLNGESIMLIRDGKSSVKAVSPVCTHKYCDVSYNPAKRALDCHCHASSFTLEGKVLGGPAKDPLPTFECKLDGDRVLVKVK